MKKIVLTMMMMGVLLIGFSQQRQLSMSEYVVSPELTEYLSPAGVEQLRASDPAELIRKNYTITNMYMVVTKLFDGNLQDKGYLNQYVPNGVSYNEDEIISNGFINPYLWNLPQDEYRVNVYKLQRSGYYVLVTPANVMRERIDAQLQQYNIHK